MQKTVKVCAILAIFLIFSNIALAKTEIMPLSEVEPGMKGIGKTVLRGHKIEEFNVEVISILEEKSPNQDLILIKTGGDVIEKTGGIASGMSGSPVYINNKLVGAVGYGWELADHRIGMVTPIESMLDLFDIAEQQEKSQVIDLKTPIKIGAKNYDKMYFSTDKDINVADNVLVAHPVSTPLMVSGLSGRAKDRLIESLDDYDIVPVASGGISDKKTNIKLEAGSAVAVQLVRGDINVSAIGTLTYRDKDQILAFGHPFLEQGNSNYLLSSAYIHQMITSIKMPFKLGAPSQLKGIINQDRSAGLAGQVGKFPNVLPLEINVVDLDLNSSQTYNVQIVQNENLMQSLVVSAILQAVDSTMDRSGGGTAKVNIEIMANKLPADIIKIDNLYYNPNDIAAASLSDFINGLGLVLYNPFTKIDLADIKFNIEIKEEARIAAIEELKLSKTKAKPGEELEAIVTLRPYRNKLITKRIPFTIPEDLEEGQLEVQVLSGAEFNLNQMAPPEEEINSQANSIKSLQELIEVYQSRKKNSELVLELGSTYTSSPKIEDVSDKKEIEGSFKASDDLYYETINTDYVLEGSLREKIEIILERDDTKQIDD